MSNPFFSIVTVSFNSEASIEKTIMSVLRQRFSDYEYIIVDGKSQDSTMDIIRRHEEEFAGKMRWISEPDKGIYDAFNKGCRMAEGRYVWIVNSDDYLEPDALEKIYGFLAENAQDKEHIVSCGMNLVTGEGRIIGNTVYSSDDLEWRMSVDSIAFAHPATVIPKVLYEKYGYYDTYYKIMADLDWSRKIWLAGEAILYAPFVVTNMTIGGISTRLNLRSNLRDRKHYFEKYYPNTIHRAIRLWSWLKMYLKGQIKAKIIMITNTNDT